MFVDLLFIGIRVESILPDIGQFNELLYLFLFYISHLALVIYDHYVVGAPTHKHVSVHLEGCYES